VTVDAVVATNTIKHPQSGTYNWYVIDVHWLDTWKAFAVLKGPRLGPITDCKLTDQFGRLRSDVHPVTDYDGVNATVWDLQERYGMVPVNLRRQSCDSEWHRWHAS